MVSLGTILTLGAIGALAAGGYAVYRNFDKLGGALSRGVETNLTNPLGNYFDNLWSGIASNASNTISNNEQIQNAQDAFQSATETFSGLADSFSNPFPPAYGAPPPTQTVPTPGAPILTPPGVDSVEDLLKITNPLPKYESGYYYFNVAGSQYDTQQYLTAEKAKELFALPEEAVFSPGGLQNVKYIGKNELGAAGFKLFGESKGYL